VSSPVWGSWPDSNWLFDSCGPVDFLLDNSVYSWGGGEGPVSEPIGVRRVDSRILAVIFQAYWINFKWQRNRFGNNTLSHVFVGNIDVNILQVDGLTANRGSVILKRNERVWLLNKDDLAEDRNSLLRRLVSPPLLDPSEQSVQLTIPVIIKQFQQNYSASTQKYNSKRHYNNVHIRFSFQTGLLLKECSFIYVYIYILPIFIYLSTSPTNLML
jgi:hypothetical protein